MEKYICSRCGDDKVEFIDIDVYHLKIALIMTPHLFNCVEYISKPTENSREKKIPLLKCIGIMCLF